MRFQSWQIFLCDRSTSYLPCLMSECLVMFSWCVFVCVCWLLKLGPAMAKSILSHGAAPVSCLSPTPTFVDCLLSFILPFQLSWSPIRNDVFSCTLKWRNARICDWLWSRKSDSGGVTTSLIAISIPVADFGHKHFNGSRWSIGREGPLIYSVVWNLFYVTFLPDGSLFYFG